MQLIVLTNRCDLYLTGTLASIAEHVTGVDRLTIVDDSGDEAWRVLLEQFDAEAVPVDTERRGYAVAMQRVFDVAEGDHVAFWEEDFRATGPIDLGHLAEILDERDHLAEIALLRQAWYANEVTAGGVLEVHANGGAEIELVDGIFEHRAFFTTNPCVLPRRTLDRPWPDGDWSESAFGQQLLKDPSVRFGMVPGILVEHVGVERAGFGY